MNRTHAKTIALWLCVAAASLALSAYLSLPGLLVWDDWSLHQHSMWAMSQYGLPAPKATVSIRGAWTAVLWPLILGIGTQYIFPWLHDPFLVRHAMTFALYPLTLLGLYQLLRKSGERRSLAFLCVALLIAYIRFGGYALVAARDFPHAAGFLLATVGTWHVLRRVHKHWSPFGLCGLGALGILPFLLRSPNIMPFPAILGVLCVMAWRKQTWSMRRRIALVALPALTACVLAIAGSPALWARSTEALNPFELFANFPWITDTMRIMGMTISRTAPPWWYTPTWIVVGLHPLALLTVLAGLCAMTFDMLVRRKTRLHEHSLERWMLFVTALTWALVFLARPETYDEDRHLLFLFPPVILLGGLGLRRLPASFHAVLSALLLSAAAISFVQWGMYAYAYKSELLPRRDPSAFMGDFRALCVNAVVEALPGLLPPQTLISTSRLPTPEIRAQDQRLTHGFFGNPRRPTFQFTGNYEEGDYELLYNMMDADRSARDATRAGKSTIVLEVPMPPDGSAACTLFRRR